MSWTVDGLAYDNRKKLTVDQTDIDSDLTDFPVTVFITGDADIGGVANADGFDIRFTTSDGSTLCKYERESWSVAGGQATAVFHVKLPSVSSTVDTDFYVYYRTADTADGADTTNVWDANYPAVWHMNQDPSGAAPQILDSTANANHGTSAGSMTSADLVAGKVGNALDFDGTDDILELGNPAALNISGNISVELWAKWSHASVNRVFIARWGTNESYVLSVHPTAAGKPTFTVRVSETNKAATSTDLYNNGIWHHLAGVFDGSNVKLIINGGGSETITGDATSGPIDTPAQNVRIGAYNNVLVVHAWQVDEIRISNIARSAAWIKATYNSGNNSLLTYGAEEIAAVASAGLSGLSGLSGLRGIC